ncbi:MAG: tripartite tricarboxylate transporter TctB family protein [Desulfobacterales bacterium]|nr:tripartite tricarboxylate transporter TctB family protein [Desulfobacterales bacterium]
MDNGLSSLFKVSIDFKESHTFFPTIVIWVLLFLVLLIFLIYGIPYVRDLRSGKRKMAFSLANMDKLRFGGTLVLTVAYFLLMDYVGRFFPNMGFGFLFVSIPFIFLLSLLYVHGVDRRKLLAISLNALIAPSVAWYVLAQLFNISLP